MLLEGVLSGGDEAFWAAWLWIHAQGLERGNELKRVRGGVGNVGH